MTDTITLKWGTLKGWNLESEDAKAIMRRYLDLGSSLSAMQQDDTDEQKALICELIDLINGDINDDWNGGTMTKESAKDYIMNYGKGRAA